MDGAFDVSKKSLPDTKSYRFFSYKNLIVWHFTFRSAIHFEFVFMKDVRSMSRLILGGKGRGRVL